MTLRLAFLAVVLCAATLQAQNREAPNATGDTARTSRIVRHLTGKTAKTAGAPRSFQVVRVAVPVEVTDADRVTYEVQALNDFNIVGRVRGSLQPRSSSDVLVTIGVPAAARAGTRPAASVAFRSRDTQVDVPIEMTVTPIYALQLQVPGELTRLRAGEHFSIPLRIQNRGNAADTARLSLDLPVGWRLLTRDTISLIIPANGVVERMVRIAIPRNSGSGNFFVRTFIKSRAAQAQALTTLTVGPSMNETRPIGPALRATSGTVAVEGEGTETVNQLELTGPLTSSIHINGRVTTTPELTGPLVRGLARVGTYISAPHLIAWTAKWRMTAGSTVLNMTDLTGLNAGGRGFSYDYSDPARALSAIAARSNENSAAGSDRGELLGAHFEQTLPFLSLGATATHLDGVGLHHQKLTAFGLQARTHKIRTLTFAGEGAYRDFTNGSGIGWTARVQHERSEERADLRVTHAPGGTAAFARAENEVHASVVKSFAEKFNIAASLVSATDKTVAERGFESASLALVPSYRISDLVRTRAELRHSSFEVAANPLGFGNKESHLGLGLVGVWRGTTLSTDMGGARLSRSVTAPDINAVDHGTRIMWRMTATRPTAIGVFQLESSYERNSDGTGYLPKQFLFTARSDRVEFPAITTRLQLDAEVTVHAWSAMKPLMVVRAGANYAMPFDTDITLAVERNPLLTGVNERAPWVVAFKIEKVVRVPRLSIGRGSGVVYRDFNGNGKRDAGEPGEPNVGVRRGSTRATTEPDGRYRFWEDASGDLVIDAATLPFGWIVGETKSGNIALIPTTRVEVTLQLGAAERLRNIDLSPVGVIARDTQGREWTGRRVSAEVAVFDALPIGTYTLDADFAALVEPLRIEGNPVVVQVREGTTATATLPIAGRPLRFRQNRP